MVSDVNINTVIREEQRTQNSTNALAQDFDDFLNLLTTQLQNQDPLNPTDTDKLTDQITQFSQVEQQINTNQKLDDLLALQLASLSSIGLGYVGLDVSYLSADLNFDGETPVTVTYALGEEAATTKINIFNEAGDLVYSQDGPRSAGQNQFTWTGNTSSGQTADDGTYTVSVDAFDVEGNVIDTSTVVTGRVRGIENQNGTIFLLVGERAVAIANVINASLPEESGQAPITPPDTPDETGGNDV